LTFKNCRGDIIKLRSKMTLGELTKLGAHIWLEPMENPPPTDPNIFQHKPSRRRRAKHVCPPHDPSSLLDGGMIDHV
jgi:hypothetical protein